MSIIVGHPIAQCAASPYSLKSKDAQLYATSTPPSHMTRQRMVPKPEEHLHFYIYVDGKFLAHRSMSFKHRYEAKYWIKQILGDRAYEIDGDNIVTWRETSTLRIKAFNLAKTLTAPDEQVTVPHPDEQTLFQLINFHIPPIRSVPRVKKPATKQNRTQSDQLTIADLAADAGITPQKARQLLRTHKIPKPTGGWTFAKSDPLIPKIQELLKT